ncbi:MAG: 2-phospho-L-lactate guanylyltransferase [Nocardioides sp.]|nr:2-phospho-L-lactate guanylyltransferase [Nocardioides sp.]
MTQVQHVVVVPAKPPVRGKSRLDALPDSDRPGLAAAFAEDTVATALRTPTVARVLVATDDAALAGRVRALGAEAVPDGDTRGLNHALGQAVSEAHRRWPDLKPVALLADLPALRPTDLERALAAAATLAPDGPAYVVDADGTGSTCYCAPYDVFAPRFGAGSAAAHADAGAHALPGDLPGLRRDVDDVDDLRAAVALGVGPRTAARLVGIDLGRPAAG